MTDKPSENQVKLTSIIGEIEIPDDDPFKHDTQGRKPLCDEFKALISECPTPYVLALDSGWGNGKSVFLKMLKACLIKDGFPCVYFDAWKSDFHSDPLPAMIATICTELERLSDKKPDVFEKIAKKFKESLKNTPGVLLSIVKHQIENYTGEEAARKAGIKPTTANSIIENYQKYHKAMETFKENLSNLVKNDKPLVFMVDELDRCRPLYALEVLEKIKHVFDTKNVFFIIALNRAEMEKTAQAIYGNINTDVYFRKFFDHTKKLISNSNKEMMGNLFEITGLAEITGLEKMEFNSESADSIAMLFGLSLRDQVQMVSTMKIHSVLSNALQTNNWFLLFNSFLIALKLGNKELLDELVDSWETRSLPIKTRPSPIINKLEELIMQKTKTSDINDMYSYIYINNKIAHVAMCALYVILDLLYRNLPEGTKNKITEYGMQRQSLKEVFEESIKKIR